MKRIAILCAALFCAQSTFAANPYTCEFFSGEDQRLTFEYDASVKDAEFEIEDKAKAIFKSLKTGVYISIWQKIGMDDEEWVVSEASARFENSPPSMSLGMNHPAPYQLNCTKVEDLFDRSSLPIRYGVGAAGITMETTFEESLALLSPPLQGPFENGVTIYEENLIVVWSEDPQPIPYIIAVTPGYVGKLEAGRFGEIGVYSTFKTYAEMGSDTGAQKLVIDLYNQLESQSDDFDCLAQNACGLVTGDEDQSNIVLQLPGAIFLMDKDEFRVMELRIVKKGSFGF